MNLPIYKLSHPGSCRTKGRAAAVVVAQAVIDDDRTDIVAHYWTLSARGYAICSIGGRRIWLHRMVLRLGTGTPEHDCVHLNGDKLDNQAANLEEVTRSDTNLMMTRHMRSDNTSGIRGVICDNRPLARRWRGQVSVAGRHYATKRFETRDEALAALNNLRTLLRVPVS